MFGVGTALPPYADVGIAQVIGEDDQDVRLVCGGQGRQREQTSEEGASFHGVRGP